MRVKGFELLSGTGGDRARNCLEATCGLTIESGSNEGSDLWSLEAAVAGARTPVEARASFPGALMADADPEQMFRVVNNLCRNAVEALDAAAGSLGRPAVVFVGGCADGHEVCLRVCDTGPGLPERARA